MKMDNQPNEDLKDGGFPPIPLERTTKKGLRTRTFPWPVASPLNWQLLDPRRSDPRAISGRLQLLVRSVGPRSFRVEAQDTNRGKGLAVADPRLSNPVHGFRRSH